MWLANTGIYLLSANQNCCANLEQFYNPLIDSDAHVWYSM